MATSRDDFVIAFRSAFLKKKDKQKFSLISLIFLSILILILSSFNFKMIEIIKSGINEIIYRTSYIISIPENKIKNINNQLKTHFKIYYDYQNLESELRSLKQKKLTNDFLKLENEKLRKLMNEGINSNEIVAKVLIDRESPFLKSIILNKGSREKVKIGMAILDGIYLVGKIIEVNYTNSRALLLSDINSKIPVILQPLDIQAIASGVGKEHGNIQFSKEEYKESFKTNEVIVYTSGLGGLFKPGLPVGKIFKDDINKVYYFSDFSQLDYVKINSYNFVGNN
jgi:rod shape-determining protein MreC